MTLPYAVDDVLTLPSGTWRVDSLRYTPYPGAKSRVAGPGDDPACVTVGLDDPANPGKHGTAVTLAALMTSGRVIKHTPAGVSVDRLVADLLGNGFPFGDQSARALAIKLVNLGWRR